MTRFYRIATVLIFQFIVVSAIAMAIYDGGNRYPSDETQYAFLKNTFSDLGRVRGYDGEPKPLTQWLFTISLGTGAAAFAAYHLVLPSLFARALRLGRRHRRRVALGVSGVAAIGGAVAGLAFVAIAAFPADRFPEQHFLAVYVAFTAFLPGAAAVVAAIMISPDYPNRYALIYLVLGAGLAAYLILIYFGPPIDSPQGSTIQIVGQKLIVYLGAVCIGAEAWTSSLVSRKLYRA